MDERLSLPGETGSEAEAAFEAPALLRILWADPGHMAEHLAIWSLTHVAPKASAAVDRLRESHPAAEAGELERMAIEHQTRVSMTEGAFVGGPFIVLIPVAFCAALLAQAQMALELAALAGYAADDENRAADLLVLQGAYASTAEASVALAAMSRTTASREGGRLPRGSRTAMIRNMAYLLGLLGASGPKQSRLRVALGWAGVTFVLLVGFVLPLVWVPYMANAMRRSSIAMGTRAGAFYAERRSSEAGVPIRRQPSVHVSMTAGFWRMIALIAVPIGLAVIAIFTDLNVGSGRLVTAGIFLLVASFAVTVAWLGYRWVRRRRKRPRPA
jgi:hypothetical protein